MQQPDKQSAFDSVPEIYDRARPLYPAEVVRGGVGGEVDVAGLRVGAHHRPGPGVAGVLPAVVLPRLVAELAGLRDDIEAPDELAGAHVEAAEVARRRLLVARATRDHLGDDHVADDDGGRDRAHLGYGATFREVLAQVDPAAAAELRVRLAGPGVDGYQAAVQGVVEEAFLRAIGPVGQRARRQRRAGRDLHRLWLEGPQRLARASVDSGHAVVDPGDVEHPVREQRRGLVTVRRRPARRIGAPAPSDLQPAHV